MPEKTTNESNVPAVSTEMLYKVQKLLGVSSSVEAADRLPQLKVNPKKKDKQGRRIQEGHFFVQGIENQSELVYAESINLRVLSQLFQWILYDPEQNKVANKTLLIPNFLHEPRDMKGTLRCGKPTSKDLRELPKATQAKYSDIRCFRQLRGLVSYSGITADKEKVTLENVPCILLLKGSNFSPFYDDVEKTMPQGKQFYDYNIKVTAEERENGSVTYYVMRFNPEYSAPLTLDTPVIDTMMHFAKMVTNENNKIEAAYNKSLGATSSVQKAVDNLALSALDQDFDSEEDFDDVYAEVVNQ